MEFRVLGDIEVLDGDRQVPSGGPKQRALLAILVLRANETVSRDRLIDELWGERPPASARHTLDSHVHRLRRALGSEGASLVRTRGAGYQLTVDPAKIDLSRFQRLAADGSRALAAGSNERAAEKLIEALAMWRGPALANLGDEPFARVEADRLEELRLAALEDRIDADLALGNHTALVGELQALVAEHPLRERFRSQLMLALYRSGRQAAALAAYQEAREYLVEELGIEPGKGLQELHTAILSHDPSLDPAAEPRGSPVLTEVATGRDGSPPPDNGEAVAIPEESPEPRQAVRGSRGLFGAAGILAALGAALAVVAISGGGGGDTAVAVVQANSAAFVGPDGNGISSDTELGGHPTDVASGAGAVWVADDASGEVLKLDPSTHAVVDRVPVPDAPSSLTTSYGSVWAASSTGGVIYEIDPESDGIVRTIDVGNGPVAIAAGAGKVWVADATDGTVRGIDPQSGRTKATVRLLEPLNDIAVGAGAVWTTSAESGVLVRIDPKGARTIESIPVGNDPQSVVVADGAVYVANPPDGTITRLDPRTGLLHKTTVEAPGALASSGGSLWVSQPDDAGLTSMDLASGAIGRRIETGSPAVALAASGGGLALVTGASPTAHRGGTLRAVGAKTPDSIDPGTSFSLAGFEILSLTNPGLVSYARQPGPAGTELVASLATSVPAPSDGGRTYSFQLRPNLRYSNGQTVEPADFRATLEREYAATRGVAAFGTPLVGSSHCSRAHCDLSRGVTVDNQARTVTFHLAKPDPAFLHKLALPFGAPVPSDSPPIGESHGPFPATGPYEIRRYVPGQRVLLTRNPDYVGTIGPADGFVDRIAVRLGLNPEQQVSAVRDGRADLMLDPPPAASVRRLLATAPAQTHPYVQPMTLAFFLDTRRPPFSSAEARRAVNYAVNRRAVVGMAGGPDAAHATCQILPEGFPGYAPYCLYTGGSRGAGTWRRPDLARARALVRKSGTAGTSVLVASDTGEPGRARIAAYIARLLDRLGYRARLRIYARSESYYEHIGRPRPGIQAGIFAWLADYPAASDFFDPLFTCAGAQPTSTVILNPAGICDPALDRRINLATGLEGRSVAAADRAWQGIDRAVTRRAPWVPLLNPRSADYVGERLGNYQRNPELGILLDRVWVR
jgi:DNA-binding SARP family transcriptional activator/ABC-type transport system substrate-binding protein/streptogramin lyase